MRINLSLFSGEKPGIANHLLKDTDAQIAQRAYLEKGDLRSYFAREHIEDVTIETVASLFKWVNSGGIDYIASGTAFDFLSYPDPGDTWERVIISGGDEPHFIANDYKSDPFDLSTDAQELGVPAPTTKITSASGYTPNGTYRAYFYTYVNRYGQEGPPSPLLEVADYGSDTVTLTGFTQPPNQHALRVQVGTYDPKIYIYRTNSSTAGTAEFQYVGSFDYDEVVDWETHTFDDDVTDANLGEVCPSTYWYPPDDDLTGFVMLPSGTIAGFMDNEVWFSDPYYPHAWPSSYMINVPYEIVGLGVIGTTIVVMTVGYPYYIVGGVPGEMEVVNISGHYPCTRKRSITSSELGVIYASADGLVRVDHNNAQIISLDVIDPNFFRACRPSTFSSIMWGGKYIFACNPIDDDEITYFWDVQKGFIYNDSHFDAFHVDTSGNLYVATALQGSNTQSGIYQFSGSTVNRALYRWRSKKILIGSHAEFAVARLILDKDFAEDYLGDVEAEEYIEQQNATLFATGEIGGDINEEEFNVEEMNDDGLLSSSNLTFSEDVTLTIYFDGVLTHTKTIAARTRVVPFKLPRDCKGRILEVELAGYVPVKSFDIATGTRELMHD